MGFFRENDLLYLCISLPFIRLLGTVVCRRFEIPPPPPHSFYRQPSLFAPSFYIYFLNPLTLITIGNIAPMIYGVNANINPCGKVISSCLEDFKTLHCFFISNTFICHTRLRFVLNLPPQLQQTPLLYRLPFSFPPFLQENLDPK